MGILPLIKEREMTFRQLTRSRLGMSVVGATVVALVGLLSACSGQSYSCPDGNHCYGTVTWSGSPSGFSMQLTPVSLTSGDIFVDDEGWLVQNFATSCAYTFDQCWVETGVQNENPAYYGGTGTNSYFWASGTAASGYMFYYLGDVAQADFNNPIRFEINQDSKTPSTWNITISRPATGKVLYSPSCTDNPMTPNTVIEGQELAGTNGAQAPLAFFTYNKVIEGSKKSYRTSDGTVCKGQSPACAGPPPNAGWWPSSKPSQTSNGGIFFTDCC
jgi:hypothetical protein